MKVRVTDPPPIEDKHGVTKDKIFEVLREENAGRGRNGVWIMGEAGEEVLLYNREHELVEDEAESS